MRQRDLEIALEAIPAQAKPRAELEQYRTPPKIAADLLFRAYALGDVAGRRVVDLGSGTGMFAIGAALLSAAEAVGVDVDPAAVASARAAAAAVGVDVAFEVADVASFSRAADVVLTNPPFGAQVRGADRAFLEAALRCAPTSYAFHLSRTAPFVAQFLAERGATVTHAWDYTFPIPWQFRFHEKRVEHVAVTVTRFERAQAPARGSTPL